MLTLVPEGVCIFSMMGDCVLGRELLDEGSALQDAETEFSIRGWLEY